MDLNLVDILILIVLLLFTLRYYQEGFGSFFSRFISLVVGISLLLFLLVFVPSPPRVQHAVQDSELGSVAVAQVVRVENYLYRLFGRSVGDVLDVLIAKPDAEERLDLPFKPREISIDEEGEREMFELVNEERLERGLPPLLLDQSLVKVARAHSADMWERQYFAHENPEGETPFDRMEEGGVEFILAGENLALARTVKRGHEGLMDSAGHRKNILDPTFGRIGIGVVDGGIYGKMFTQNFAD